MDTTKDEKTVNLDKAQHNLLAIPNNKRDANRIGAMIIGSILDGDVNPLETEIKLRYIESIIEQVRKNANVKDAVLTEAEKYPEKTFSEYGADITKTRSSRYDYSGCGDSVRDGLANDITALNEKKKEREKMLQGLAESMVIEETGEIIYPPVKSSSDVLRVKLL